MQSASSPVIVTEEAEVGEALASLGLTVEIVRRVAIAAASARAESLPVDPAGAPGQLSYIHGVRAMRLDLLSIIGWEESRAGNVESMVNHLIGVQVCFQNVDRACKISPPLAISGKGSASRRLVNSGQLELFASSSEASYLRGRNPAVWYICVSVDVHGVFAEVSCPRPFDGNQFDGFVKRLFVVSESLEPKPASRSDDDDLDFDVTVSKK